jgi:pyruvate/2-oxoglutarate dehydrogenase complex dihydrolipoamide acyltransferase (E2) component
VLLSLTMPSMGQQMISGNITFLGIAVGDQLKVGLKLLDVRVDLSTAAPQDCPPIFYFRMVAREPGWVRQIAAAVGEEKTVGAVLALISTEPDEPLDGPVARSLRAASAAILPEFEWPGSV